MPQFDQVSEIFASQLFWLAIFFGILFVVVGLGMVPKIQATADARDDKIAGDLKEAGTARETAERIEEDYRLAMDRTRAEAARVAAAAKAEAAKATEAKVAAADKALHARLDEANARIASARAGAMKDIETVAVEAAQAMVERITGAGVDASAARQAVAQELARG